MTAEKNCAARVAPAWEDVRQCFAHWMEHGDCSDIYTDSREYLEQPKPEDFDDDTEFTMATRAWSAEEKIAQEYWSGCGDFHEYGLAFEYVEPFEHSDQPEGYWRFVISTGGPGTELRFFATLGARGYVLHRAEFWLLDWFDGASIDVTATDEARWCWDQFHETETVEHAMRETMGFDRRAD